jgi:phosphatidylinositol phospholipase C delta
LDYFPPVDIWDGPEEPIIYHGRTLTSRLPVRDALTAIGKYAFIASPYPVILSIEVHCEQPQQDKLADILRATLGPALLDAPMFGEVLVEEHAGCAKVEVLPSPEHLKYRILVKAKNLYVVKAAQQVNDPEMASESSSSASSDSDLKRGEAASTKTILLPADQGAGSLYFGFSQV